MHIWDLRTCTYAICGLAHTRFAEVQLFPRGCHVATTWQTRCNHVAALPQIAYVQVRKSRMCKSARPQIAYVQVRKSQMCMCARPQIEYVHIMTAATYRATVLHACSTCTHIPYVHTSSDHTCAAFICYCLIM